jgi:protein TonB
MFAVYALLSGLAATPAQRPPVYAMGVECRPSPGLLHTYFSDQDYPASALRNREEGTVEFCVRIGQNGLVSDCTILSSSGFADLDAATCDITRARVRFVPAHDANGIPVPDGMMARIRWVLPPRPKAEGVK